jgi:hypothetical protein
MDRCALRVHSYTISLQLPAGVGQPLEPRAFENGPKMTTRTTIVLFVASLILVIVAVDVLFFKNRFWERLTANVGIVLVFAAFYFRFLKRL